LLSVHPKEFQFFVTLEKCVHMLPSSKKEKKHV